MATPPEPLDPWAEQAIELMLEERLPFHIAVNVLGLTVEVMSAEQGAAYQRRKSFREAWQRLSRRHFEAKASAAQHSKTVLLGKMYADADVLAAAGRLKEANEVRFQAAKVEGLVGEATTINIWDSVSGRELAEAKERLAAMRKESETKPN